ncbi:MAG: hypothetical protein ABJA57_02855 [Ginsengibacter sp.]
MIPKRRLVSLVLFALPLFSLAQENSAYSRYGIGNLSPSGNILNRGMGGISAAYADPATINSINPASYANLIYTTLDIAAEMDSRTMRSQDPQGKFTSNNAIFSYLQLGIPLLNGNKKALKKDMSWGISFGLRPVSRIDYSIRKNSRVANIDSLVSLYEGSGGVNEAFAGTGIRIRDFNFGINVGYLFGSKDYGTRISFVNDTVSYYSSNSATKTNFGGVFLNAGLQYAVKIKNGNLRLGAYGNFQKKYNATQDVTRETFAFNSITGNPDKLDSVLTIANQKGTIVIPATYGLGFNIERIHWTVGADFEMSNWNNYSFYGQKDFVKNNWIAKAGFQYLPATAESKKYWNFVKYRAGIFFGPDYINADKNLPQYGVSAGAGFPLKLKRAFYETQYSIMNLSLEYASRGNKNNNIRENILRVGVGFSLSDLWFRRYKYD